MNNHQKPQPKNLEHSFEHSRVQTHRYLSSNYKILRFYRRFSFFIIKESNEQNQYQRGYSDSPVFADFAFTTTAVIAQPVTGLALAWYVGYSLWEHWIVSSIVLYLITGAFWLPVVWIQMEMREIAKEAAANGEPLPADTIGCSGPGFIFGFPAFVSVLGILWLMITRPVG